MIKTVVVFLICLIPTLGFSQKKSTKIKLQHADMFEYVDDGKGKKTRRLTGNVSFKHEDMLMFCDSALLYPKLNSLDAYGHVRIEQGGGMTITGDSLHYNGNTKLADINGNVVMVHNDTKLTTSAMTHNLTTNSSTYRTGGTLVDKDNVLTSRIGIYRANSKKNKFDVLQIARERVEVIRLFIRLMKDLKQISTKKFVRVNIKVESVSKQLTGWQKSLTKNTV